MTTTATNLPASVHRRLLNLSRTRGQDFNQMLTFYALERFLYRLSQSPYADQFILKGALLFLIWDTPVQRPTRDLDLLGYGDSSAEHLRAIIGAICQHPVTADGLEFAPETIRIEEIRADQEYQGQRVDLIAHLGRARIAVRIDIGFGDQLSQAPVESGFPTLLDFPEPVLHTYPKESVIAEKAHAMVVLGLTNSRMKDFYDLWSLARFFSFEGIPLTQAIEATFNRRQTPISLSIPPAWTPAFAEHPDKVIQWRAFLNRTRLDVDDRSFAQIIADMNEFLAPPWQAIASGESFEATWPARGPWSTTP